MQNRFLIAAFLLLIYVLCSAFACDVNSGEYDNALKNILQNGCQYLFFNGQGSTAGSERCCFQIKQTNCAAELIQLLASKTDNFNCVV